jgi:hypothetical protein
MCGRITGPGEREDPPMLGERDLRNQVSRGAKSVQPDSCTLASGPECAVADEPGTQKGRRLRIRILARQLQHISRVGDAEVRKSPIDCATGELRAFAQVFHALKAVAALATSACKPRDAHAIANVPHGNRGAAFDDMSDDLVARYYGIPRIHELAIQEMKIRPAYAAHSDLHENVVIAQRAQVNALQHEITAG